MSLEKHLARLGVHWEQLTADEASEWRAVLQKNPEAVVDALGVKRFSCGCQAVLCSAVCDFRGKSRRPCGRFSMAFIRKGCGRPGLSCGLRLAEYQSR